MNYGYIDLIILILIFIGLQIWWIINLFKRNQKINRKNINSLRTIDLLEKIYKRNDY